MRAFGVKDLAELNAQFDNRARVPEHPAIFDRWRMDSLSARESLICQLDVPYGESPAESVDIFFPPEHNRPVMVFMHGGYWRAMDKSDYSFIATPFVAAGFGVVVANYALAPSVSMREIAEQTRRAIIWLWRNAEDLGFDRTAISVSGHSAGGHLTALLMSTEWSGFGALPKRLVRSGLSISGIFDLEPIRLSGMNADLRMDKEEAAALSPVNFVPDDAGPLVLGVGADESDAFHHQQDVMVSQWRARGLPVSEVPLPGRNHFTALDALVEPNHPLHLAMRGLLSADRG